MWPVKLLFSTVHQITTSTDILLTITSTVNFWNNRWSQKFQQKIQEKLYQVFSIFSERAQQHISGLLLRLPMLFVMLIVQLLCSNALLPVLSLELYADSSYSHSVVTCQVCWITSDILVQLRTLTGAFLTSQLSFSLTGIILPPKLGHISIRGAFCKLFSCVVSTTCKAQIKLLQM